jgi:hypothetical protein
MHLEYMAEFYVSVNRTQKKPANAVRFSASNPLSQVGVRKTTFEVPFRGHVSHGLM